MKQYHLTVTAKTKKSLYDFLSFLNNTDIDFNIIKKDFKNKKRKTKFTILKSPHIYKTAQEQFQSTFFSNKIAIYSNSNFQFLIFLKKIKNNIFPDLKIKIKFPINKNLSNKTQTLILNPNNFKLNILNKLLHQKKKIKKHRKRNYKEIEHLLKIFDLYSEFTQK